MNSGYLIRLEGVASPRTPQEAVGELADIARHLGVGVICDVNGTEAFAFPYMTAAEAIRLWELARRTGPTVATVTRKHQAAKRSRGAP